MIQPEFTQIIRLTQLPEKDFAVLYPYGSRVYGTNSPQSDYDYIMVFDGQNGKDAQQYDSHDGKLSVHTYSSESWQQHLNDHKIFAMECHFILPVDRFNFKLNHALLRKEISSKASNSWVKCKKKLTVETNEYHIGIKSLFHSFRIPMFGIQIATEGSIVDYSVANDLWFNEFEPMLLTMPTWDQIKEIYQPRHNELMSEFRKVAEKL